MRRDRRNNRRRLTVLRVVAFDWGGTLMEDPGVYPGPMARWPVVSAVPGAAETLAALAPRYRLVVATNADESGGGLVLAALARVALDDAFEAVFSSADLGVTKPDTTFYHAMADRLGVPARAIVMVGDNHVNDVAGARAAGLHAVWLDRRPPGAGAAVPGRDGKRLVERSTSHAAPRIRALDELPAVIATLAARLATDPA